MMEQKRRPMAKKPNLQRINEVNNDDNREPYEENH
jgi:hypothetical protein